MVYDSGQGDTVNPYGNGEVKPRTPLEDTVNVSGEVEDNLRAIAEQGLCKRIDDRLKELYGSAHQQAADRIKAGTHTLNDVFEYQKRLSDLLREGHYEDTTTGKLMYSDLAAEMGGFIISDFEQCLGLGSTFKDAVERLNKIGGRRRGFSPDSLVPILRDLLYGRSPSPDTDYGVPFPSLLTTLWTLKMLKPVTYYNALNSAKWAALIGEAVNAFNADNDVSIRADPVECFLYAFAQNCGMFHPDMPKKVDSDRILLDDERDDLEKHGKKSPAILANIGFLQSNHLVNVVRYHTSPEKYALETKPEDRDQLTATLIGISTTAEAFDGLYYNRAYRKGKLTPREVFAIIEAKLFTEEDLKEIKKLTRFGYRYDAEQAEKHPRLQPYQMLRLLFGIMEHPQD